MRSIVIHIIRIPQPLSSLSSTTFSASFNLLRTSPLPKILTVSVVSGPGNPPTRAHLKYPITTFFHAFLNASSTSGPFSCPSSSSRSRVVLCSATISSIFDLMVTMSQFSELIELKLGSTMSESSFADIGFRSDVWVEKVWEAASSSSFVAARKKYLLRWMNAAGVV